jgi:hypothetical protein
MRRRRCRVREKATPEPAEPLGHRDESAGEVAAVDGRDVPGR